jgi:putative FmdB family regulatory protein
VPIYTYACSQCGQTIEKRQSFSDAPLTTCEGCGGDLRKVIHPVGIVFKGSGWYVNDSRSSSKSTTAASSDGEKKSDTAASTESGSKESSNGKESAPAATKADAPKADTKATSAASA